MKDKETITALFQEYDTSDFKTEIKYKACREALDSYGKTVISVGKSTPRWNKVQDDLFTLCRAINLDALDPDVKQACVDAGRTLTRCRKQRLEAKKTDMIDCDDDKDTRRTNTSKSMSARSTRPADSSVPDTRTSTISARTTSKTDCPTLGAPGDRKPQSRSFSELPLSRSDDNRTATRSSAPSRDSSNIKPSQYSDSSKARTRSPERRPVGYDTSATARVPRSTPQLNEEIKPRIRIVNYRYVKAPDRRPRNTDKDNSASRTRSRSRSKNRQSRASEKRVTSYYGQPIDTAPRKK